MGKNTKIIATVVPVRMDEKAQSLIMDVFFSPRLPDSGLLEDYYEIKNWPAYADMLMKEAGVNQDLGFNLELFTIAYKDINNKYTYRNPNQSAIIDWKDIEVIEKKDPYIRYRLNDGRFFRSDNDAGYPLSKDNPLSAVLWNQMFRDETPVSGWLVNEVDYSLAAKVSRNELIKSLSDAIDRTIEELLSNDGYSQNVSAGPGEIATFVLYLHQLKAQQPEVIANDPMLRSNPVNNYQRTFVKNLHETIKRLIDKNDQQVKDLSIVLTAQEQELRNAQETGEFHKRFSAYSNYPFLLRNTGWIWELKVPLAKLNKKARELITQGPINGEKFLKYIKINFSDELDWNKITGQDAVIIDGDSVRLNKEQKKRNQISRSLFLHEIKLLSPSTCFEANIKDNIFQPGDNPEFGKRYFKIDHGVIIARPPVVDNNVQYEIRPQLIDKVQLFEKLRNILTDSISKDSSVAVPSQDQSYLQSIDREFQFVQGDSRGSSKGNEYVSNGISLNIHNLQAIMQNVLKADPEAQTGTEAGITLRDTLTSIRDGLVYAHNLHVGYRVDVAMFEGAKLAGVDSLCKRKEYYCICVGKGNVWAENPSEVEEGWIMESTQASQSGLTYVDDELFRWNDWSLVCPQLGEHEDVERPDEEELQDPTRLNISEVPPDGSLIPLRFGNSYRFRLRVVDICGNNSGYLDEPVVTVEKDDTHWTDEVLYERLDSINTPLIIPGHRIYSGVELVDNDPSRRRLIWDDNRLGEDLETLVVRAYFEGNTLKTNQSSIRYVGPPKANLHFVLKHKVLDDTLSDSTQAEEIKNDLFDRADLEVMPSDIYFKRTRESINYLFDPVVTGFDAIHERRRHERKQVTVDQLSATTSPYWKSWQYLELRMLRAASTEPDRVKILSLKDDGNYKMTVKAKPGVETDILLGCTYFSDVDAIFHECVEKVKRSRIKFVHAVQKPCLINERYAGDGDPVCRMESVCKPLIDPLSRVPEKNSFTFRMFFQQYPVYTTDAAILHIQYADIVSDRTTSKGYRFNHVQRVIKTGLRPDTELSESNVTFNNLEFIFPDNKFRRVNLRMESVSKFKQYFKPVTGENNKDYFSVFASPSPWVNLDDADEWEEGERVVRKDWEVIKNTNRPEPLIIERIVPLVSWKRDTDSIERYADTIRVYFEGDWYSSGEEEKVALIYMDEGDANSACVPLELENVISQFGKDPAGEPQIFEKWAIVLSALKNETMFLSPGVGYVKDIEVSKLEFDTSPTTEQPFCQTPVAPKVKAAIFKINYAPPSGTKISATQIDSQDSRGKFYVDIKLNMLLSKNFYFPFVRFALARYQENSLITEKDYRFSKITVADFVQMLPYRKLDIVRDDRKLISHINYHAPTYRKDKHAKGSSRVYLYTQDKFFFANRQLAERIDDPDKNASETGIPIISTLVSLPVKQEPSHLKYVIEEYEEYQFEEVLEDESDPRKDYTKRLIFSYIIDP